MQSDVADPCEFLEVVMRNACSTRRGCVKKPCGRMFFLVVMFLFFYIGFPSDPARVVGVSVDG